MMKTVLYIVLLVSFTCCLSRPSNDKNGYIKYYPSKDLFLSKKLVEIDLNNSKLNFKKISNRMFSIQLGDSIPFISIKDNDTIRNWILIRTDGAKYYNLLRLSKDSIFLQSENQPISKLDYFLEKHYKNNGDDLFFAETPNVATIEIKLDTSSSGLELKKVIKRVTQTFDRVNKKHADSLRLKIGLFDKPPKPPFPLPILKENEWP